MRTKLLSQGCTLSEVTRIIAERFGLSSRILPMSDQRVQTRIDTPAGELSFEEYFVKRWFQDPVNSVRFAGASETVPAPGVLDTIASAQAVLIAPSNPVTSIGPILAVPGIREALAQTKAPVVAVSPIIGSAAVSGPAATLMAAHGLEVSIRGVAAAYQGFLDMLVAHTSDAAVAEALTTTRFQVHCANILMETQQDRSQVARTALSLACPQIVTAYAAEVE